MATVSGSAGVPRGASVGTPVHTRAMTPKQRPLFLSVRASREELDRIRSEARNRGISVSEMVRLALERDGVNFASVKK